MRCSLTCRQIWTTILVVLIITLLGGVVKEKAIAAVEIDMIQALRSREQSVEKDGNWETFYKTAIEGNIYGKAYSLAQLRQVGPTVTALEATTQYLTDRCEEVNLTIQDVTNVFSYTPDGTPLLKNMDAIDILGDEVTLGQFDLSCLKVVGCYYYDYLQSLDPPMKVDDLIFTNNISNTCRGLITDLYTTMHTRTSSIESFRDANFGDELFANGELSDAPYDLLVDVKQIGDLLFAHNDPPAKITFYTPGPSNNYTNNDPYETTPYEVEQPGWDEEDRTRRWTPTIGIPEQLPELPQGIYPPQQELPPSEAAEQPLEKPSTPGGLDTVPVGGAIQNNLCVEPSLPTPDDDILEDAREEFEQTNYYNEGLVLDDRVAIALGAKLLPEIEKSLIDDPYGIQLRNDPDIEQQVDEISSDDVLGKDGLEALEEKFKECIEQYTIQDANSFKKVVWKTLTQPTALSDCITQAMCKEVGGKVGNNPRLGDYRIKVCKLPAKRTYGVVNNQPVTAIEEVIDELSNVCLGLRESGQLIEHNKTKDQWDHGLMRVKLGEKVSFSISVSFAGPVDEEDLLAEARKRREKNDYFQKTILNITDDLSFEKERDKYILIASDQPLQDVDAALDAATKRNAYHIQRDDSGGVDKTKVEQITHYAQLLDELDLFLDHNTYMRKTVNDYVHSLNASRQGEKSEYSKKP